jgi:hypothetical protein
VPKYAPGYPALLAQAGAIGGVEAMGWVSLLAALLLGALVAWLAAELAGLLVVPVAVAAVLFHRDVVTHAQVVMSDLPTTTLLLAELVLLVRAARTGSVVAVGVAGFTAGYLTLMRPATAVLLITGVVALSALGGWRSRGAVFVISSLPALLLLGLWQWWLFGSPFVTGYQAQGASPTGDGALSGLFHPSYALGPPPLPSGRTLPNALVYVAHMLGLDGSSLVPGLGLVGAIVAWRWARRAGVDGLVGRFVLCVAALMLLVYVPYFWQDTRFVMAPTVLLTVCGVAGAARFLARRLVAGLLQFRRATPNLR